MSLVVVRAMGLCTVQDLGRRGYMHQAIPPGGALVPELLVAANRVAGNLDGAAAIEVCGRVVVRAIDPVGIATEGGTRTLDAGEELSIVSEPKRVAYLALRGGIAAPTVLGSRAALLCANLGAPLRAGDELRIGHDTGGIVASPTIDLRPETQTEGDVLAIDVLAGPDFDAFTRDALDILAGAPYRIDPGSNRVGTRLVGPTLPREPAYRERSRPMVRGAIEVPRDGQPIVLGPEHPTTGGYPLIGVIAAHDLGRFHAIRLGGSVRFRINASR